MGKEAVPEAASPGSHVQVAKGLTGAKASPLPLSHPPDPSLASDLPDVKNNSQVF